MSAREHIIILGGDFAAPFAAAYLSRMLPAARYQISYIDTGLGDLSGIYSAGHADLAMVNKLLQMSEPDFIRRCHATLKLGEHVQGWGARNYMRPFANYGASLDGIGFLSLAMRAGKTGNLADWTKYCLPSLMAQQGKFAPPAAKSVPIASDYSYSYNLDPRLYAKLLTMRAQHYGAALIQAQSVDAKTDKSGVSVTLPSGETLSGDFLINASGAPLQGQSWTAWAELPGQSVSVKRAAATPTLSPATHHTLGEAYSLTAPLQSGDLSLSIHADSAGETPFTQGHIDTFWAGRILNIGQAAARFLPLDSLPFAMLHGDLERFVELLPPRFDSAVEGREYNRRTGERYDRLYDFLAVMCSSCAAPGPFGDAARAISVPKTAQYKIDLFKARGRIAVYDEETMLRDSWLPAMLGQGVWPERHDPMSEEIEQSRIKVHLTKLAEVIEQICAQMPSHEAFIARHCASPEFAARHMKAAP